MQLISNRYIPTEEVRRLTAGSYEHLIARIEDAVRAEVVHLLGAKIEASVVGTFPGSAIILAEDGRFVRVKYEDKQGSLTILSHETLQVASFAPDKLDDYLKSESQKAADSFVQGDVAGALQKLKGLVRFVEHKNPARDAQIVDALVMFHRSDRPWKKVFAEKADTIRRMMLDEVASIHEDRLHVKFRSLYDGSVSETDLETYRELVIESLNKIGERADRLHTQVSAALSVVKAKKIDDDAVVSLLAFGEDLVEDLNTTRKTARDATQRVRQVESLGKLHDSFAEDFRDRELAGRFVMKMSQRLDASAHS
jgi:hypothetical protein